MSEGFDLSKLSVTVTYLKNVIQYLLDIYEHRLKKGRSTVLFFHGSEYDRLYFRDLMAAISRSFVSHQIDLVCVTSDSQGGLKNLLTSLEKRTRRPAGAIILPSSLGTDSKKTLLQYLPRLKIPLIVLDRESEFNAPPGLKASRIFFDNGSGSNQLKDLMDTDSPRQAWWVGHESKVSDDEAIRKNCRSHWDRQLECEPRHPRESAFHELISILKSEDEALPKEGLDIVCVNDDVAIGIDDALIAWSHISSYQPDVRVLSFDCCRELIERRDKGNCPSFIVGGVKQSPEKMAEEIAQVIRNGGGIDSAEIILPETDFRLPTTVGPSSSRATAG